MQDFKGTYEKEVEKAPSIGESQPSKLPVVPLDYPSLKSNATNPQENSVSKVIKEAEGIEKSS